MTHAALAFLLFNSVASPPKASPESVAKRLEGTWCCIAFIQDGETIEKKRAAQLQFTFKDDHFVVRHGSQVRRGVYKTSGDSMPHGIDLIATDDASSEDTADLQLGIVQIRDGLLWICLSKNDEQRPTTFESKPNSPNRFLMRFKRRSEP